MISDRDQRVSLESAVDLIMGVLDNVDTHKNQSVCLSVAGKSCLKVAEMEKRKAFLDDEWKNGKEKKRNGKRERIRDVSGDSEEC